MTQDVLAPRGGAHLHDPHGPVVGQDLTEVERAARLAGATPRPAAVQPPLDFPAVQPWNLPAGQPGDDAEATIVIGRHRRDGTRSLPGELHPPEPLPRLRFVGRVAAGVVALLRGVRW